MHRRYTHPISIGLLVLAGLLATACVADEIDLSVAPVDAAEPRSNLTPTVTISPLSGPAGTVVEVTGSGFGAYAQISVRAGAENAGLFEVATGTADADGTFVAHVEADGEPGVALVFTVGADGQLGIVSGERFRITGVQRPVVSISPLSGPPGAIVEVVASGFPAYAHVSVGAGPENSEFVEVAEGTADADGLFSAHVQAEGAPDMRLVFAVSADGQPGVLCPDRFQIIELRDPAVSISPLSGPPSTIVEVVASGFEPFAEVIVHVGPENSEFVQVAEGTADANGFFSAHVEAHGAPGMRLVFAVSADGQPGVLCPDRFQIIELRDPAVSISPQSGPTGTIVAVVGSDFAPFAEVIVHVGPENSEFVQVAEGTADANGFFSAHVEAQGAPGMTLVFAVSANGQPGVLCPDRFHVTEKASSWTTYSSEAYAVSFQRPSQWVAAPEHSDPELGELSFAGEDGFFLVGALESPASIDAVAAGEANHPLLPYGSHPTIEPLVVAGQEARLIRPSVDQYPSMRGQAALIVRYPEPVIVQGHPFNYFVLYADVGHIETLAQSLSFAGW